MRPFVKNVLPVLLMCFGYSGLICGFQDERGGKGRQPNSPPTENKPSKPSPPKADPAKVATRSHVPTSATLTIISNPTGATVLINGRAKGTTDSNGQLTVPNLKPGTYILIVRKPGYRDEQRSVSLSSGEDGHIALELGGSSGRLSVLPSVEGAQIELSNGGSYENKVNDLPISPGRYTVKISKSGYLSVVQEVEIRPGQRLDLSIILQPLPVDQIIGKADLAYKNKNYNDVFTLCRDVLSAKSDNAPCYLLMGRSFYDTGRYAESVEYLVRAVQFGGEIRLSIKHRREFLTDEGLASGLLTAGNNTLSFTAIDERGRDFSVRFNKIAELRMGPQGGWRLSVALLIPKKNGKEERRVYDFHVDRAYTTQVRPQGASYTKSVIYCNDCESEVKALYDVLLQLKGTPNSAATVVADPLLAPPDGRVDRQSSTEKGGSVDKRWDPNRIYSGKEVTQKARILSKPEPEYTEEARKNQITGTVVLRAVFTADGDVTDIRSVSGLPFGLTERAIAAAQQIKFAPAIKDGHPVSMYIQLEYNFNPY